MLLLVDVLTFVLVFVLALVEVAVVVAVEVFTFVLALVEVLLLVLLLVAVAVVVVVFVLLLVLVAVEVEVFVFVFVLTLVLLVVVLLVVSNEFCSQNSVPAVQSGFSGSFSAAAILKENSPNKLIKSQMAIKVNQRLIILFVRRSKIKTRDTRYQSTHIPQY